MKSNKDVRYKNKSETVDNYHNLGFWARRKVRTSRASINKVEKIYFDTFKSELCAVLRTIKEFYQKLQQSEPQDKNLARKIKVLDNYYDQLNETRDYRQFNAILDGILGAPILGVRRSLFETKPRYIAEQIRLLWNPPSCTVKGPSAKPYLGLDDDKLRRTCANLKEKIARQEAALPKQRCS